MGGNELQNGVHWSTIGGGMVQCLINMNIYTCIQWVIFVRCCHVWWVQNGNGVRNLGWCM